MMSKSTITPMKLLKQLPIAWKPHAYQKKAVKFGLMNSCAGLFLDPGLGKTSILLAIAKVLMREGLIDKLLIIAPLRPCYTVWPDEIEKWLDFKDMTYTILHGKDKEKNYNKDVQVYIINPEGLEWLFGHKDFKKRGNWMLGVDESSKFKSTQSKRFKILRANLKKFNRRYVMTGSLAPNGLLDLFGQFYILDEGAALGQYITHYRTMYFYPTGFGGYEWKLQPGAKERIEKKIKPLSLRMEAEDYLELPDLIMNYVYIDLPPEAQAIYDEMEEDLIAAVEKGDIVAVNAAVASGKCSQIANGGIYDEYHKAHHIHDKKTEAVADLVEEINGVPALIAYEYGHDLTRLLAALGKDTPYIGGGVTAKRGKEICEAWNAGEITELLGQPASMAHGLNLQNAGNHVIMHSIPWNFEYYDQFIRRIRRQGSKHKKVFVHMIIARGTIDEVKIHSLNRKYRVQKDLFDALKTYLGQKKTPLLSAKAGLERKSIVQTTKLPKEEITMSKFAKAAAKAEDNTAETATEEKATKAKSTKAKKETKATKPAKGKAKAGKAGKPAKAKKEVSEKEPDGRKIKLITKDNPKREGSASYDRYALYENGMTVQDFIDAGGTAADLRSDEAKGHIAVK